MKALSARNLERGFKETLKQKAVAKPRSKKDGSRPGSRAPETGVAKSAAPLTNTFQSPYARVEDSAGGAGEPEDGSEDLSAANKVTVEATQRRIKKFQKLKLWAAEEQVNGRSVFYWHIMSNRAMKILPAQAPTTVDELKALGELGDNILNEYSERLAKNIRSFIENEGLQEYVANRRPIKRPRSNEKESSSSGAAIPRSDLKTKRTPSAARKQPSDTNGKSNKKAPPPSNGRKVVEILDDDMDDDIDFLSIEIPNATKNAVPNNASKYFS
jgi:hypothetical protein